MTECHHHISRGTNQPQCREVSSGNIYHLWCVACKQHGVYSLQVQLALLLKLEMAKYSIILCYVMG